MRFFNHRYFVAALAVIFFAARLAAQLPDYHVRMLPQKSGLVYPGQVEELIKDDKGFLWFITTTNVQRFDGKNILSFSLDDRCINIQQDGGGTIFVATRQNIYRYKNDYSGFEILKEYTSTTSRYRALLAGPGKKLYLLTNDGILWWNRQSGKMEPTGIPAFKSIGSFPFLKSFGNCLFYKLNDSILARYNVATAVQDAVAVKDASYLVVMNEDSVWVRQSIGGSVMVSFKTKTTAPVTGKQFTDSFADNIFFITGGFAFKEDNFIVAINNQGYYSYDRAKKIFTKINLFYAGRTVEGKPVISNNTLYREDNGTAWFANEEGFIYFNPLVQNIGLLRSKATGGLQQWDDDIRNLTEDDKGNIWFGTAYGFCKWDKASGNVTAWKPDFAAEKYLNYPSIKGLGYSNGKIIIGQSEKGFWIYDPERKTFQRPLFEADSLLQKFRKGFNANMLKLRNGNFLILSGNIWLMNGKNFTTSLVKTDEPFTYARAAYEDAQGRIWLAGRNGICAMDSNFELLYSLPDKTLGRWCNAIVQQDDNTFWIAAKTLYEVKLRPQKQLAIRPIFPELKNVHLSNLFKDSLGNIWMASNDGMYRFVKEKNVIEKFDQGDNTYNFYEGVSNHFRSSNGIVYFGSLSGINYFTPEKIPLQDEPLQVQLLNVTINRDDSSYLMQGSLPRLKYFQNVLSFDFIAPYLHNAEKVQYRYKMEGTGNDWINLGNVSTVHFTSLQPGKYVFTAAASLNGKDWYAMQSPFVVLIKPPFWQTWWFRSLLAVAAILLIAFYLRRRINIIKIKAAIKQQITELEVKALRAQMNPHFIFNAMNSIQQFTLKNDVDNANLYISKFSTLLRKVLHSSQQNYVTLEQEIEQLNLYLDIEKLRLGNEFSYYVKAGDEIETDALKIPGMMVQPFVENALKHGLSPKEGKKNLSVEFLLTADNKLEVTVTDNGIGRKKAEELKQQQQKLLPYESKGIQLVKERLQLLNKSVKADFLSIEDLADKDNNPAGTKITLLVPLSMQVPE